MKFGTKTNPILKLVTALILGWVVAALPLVAQDSTPPASQASPPEGQTPAPPPPPPILTNNGKPMVLPFLCTAEDLQAAGFSCSEEVPCPVYLELSAAAGTGNHYLVAGNIHSDAVTLYSVLIGSEDGGRIWQEPYKRIRGAGLDHLQFLDPSTVWAAGQQLFPLPQEPFVLLTTDGGKNWRQQSVFDESVDNRFGSVQEMRFTSKTAGSLIIDKSEGGDAGPFALYESPDGGETWGLKEQSSKPLHLKPAPGGDADWRVRVDGPAKAFLVEHRQGERWMSHASFAVDLGACKVK